MKNETLKPSKLDRHTQAINGRKRTKAQQQQAKKEHRAIVRTEGTYKKAELSANCPSSSPPFPFRLRVNREKRPTKKD